ncbi:MAG: rhomboid family intramembrane serine protease [Gemmatimonadales bacterium]
MTPWVTRLLFLNAGMFLLQWLFPAFFFGLALLPNRLLVEPWTAVTYMFLHGSPMHLFFNMFGLFIFGPRVEERLGPRRFIMLYLLSGLGGALLSLLTPASAIVGASGALFGVMYAFAHFWPHAGILVFPLPFPIPARILVFFAAGLSLLLGVRGGGGVAHFAHLGGFAAAFIYLRLAQRFSPAARFKAQAMAPPPRPSGTDRKRWEQIDRDELHPLNRDELDRILDKIGREGLAALSAAERTFLERFSRH